jgi:hypothetical protein
MQMQRAQREAEARLVAARVQAERDAAEMEAIEERIQAKVSQQLREAD